MDSTSGLILQAIELGSAAVAQQLLAKQLKRAPGLVHLLSLQAYAHVREGKVADGLAGARAAAANKPGDPATLRVLFLALRSGGEEAEAFAVYEHAAKHHRSAALAREWFENCVLEVEVRSLQKAAMHLAKQQPSRQHTLWAAVGCLVATDPRVGAPSALEIRLFPLLAVRMLELVRPFTLLHEVYVYLAMQQAVGTPEALRALVDAVVEISGDGPLDTQLRLQAFAAWEQLQDWESVYRWGVRVLVDHATDDYATWKAVVEAAVRLGRGADAARVMEDYAPTRNRMLAQCVLAHALGAGALEAVAAYYGRFAAKPCAYTDVCRLVDDGVVTAEAFMEWLAAQPTALDEYSVVNHSKLTARFGSAATTEELVARFKQWQKRPALDVDPVPASELLVMAALDELKRLADSTAAVKAIMLLDLAVAGDPHCAPARLWLTRLHFMLGCGEAAWAHFSVLKVKELQHDSLAHMWLPRYLSLFDHSRNDTVARLLAVVNFYQNNTGELEGFVHHGLVRGSFSTTVGIVELCQRLRSSSTRRVLAVECVRVGRACGNQQLVLWGLAEQEAVGEAVGGAVDNSDRRVLWQCGVERVDEEVEAATAPPVAGASWSVVQACCDKLVRETKPAGVKALQDTLAAELGRSQELTPVEAWLARVMLHLLRHHSSKDAREMELLLQTYGALPPAPPALLWSNTHHHAVRMRTLTGALLYLGCHLFPKKFEAVHAWKAEVSAAVEQFRTGGVAEVRRERARVWEGVADAVQSWGSRVGVPTDGLGALRTAADDGDGVLRRL